MVLVIPSHLFLKFLCCHPSSRSLVKASDDLWSAQVCSRTGQVIWGFGQGPTPEAAIAKAVTDQAVALELETSKPKPKPSFTLEDLGL